MDLEDVRLKEADELDDKEKALLKENWDDLTEEEQSVFKDTVNPEEKKKEGKEEEFKFESKEELDKTVQDKVDARLAEIEKEKKEAEDKAKQTKEGEDEPFFPEGYQAKDWNEAAKTLYPKFREKIFKEQSEARTKAQEQIDNINKEFDEEIKTIAKENKDVPAEGTKEREVFEKELGEIGIKYKGVTTMTDAYDIYKALHSGGEKKEEVGIKQRDLASKVGRTGGEGTEVKERTYAKLSGSSMDALVEEELAKMGVKD